MNAELQERVLALLLTNENQFELARPFLKADYFEEGFHRSCYDVLEDCFRRVRRVPTPREFRARLAREAETEGHVGLVRAQWEALAERVGSLAVTPVTAAELAEFIARREMVAGVADIGTDNAIDVAQKLRNRLDELSPLLSHQGRTNLPERLLCRDYLAVRLNRVQDEDTRDLISLGYTSLDAVTQGGLYRGEVGMVMAMPGRGKSMWLLNLAVQALTNDYRVVHVSMENVKSVTEKRLYARVSGKRMDPSIPVREIHDEVEQWMTDNGIRPEQYLYWDLEPHQYTVGQLRGLLKNLVEREGPFDVLVLDYLDQLRPEQAGRDEATHTSLYKITEGLVGIAKSLGIVVLTATQANRQDARRSREDVNWLIQESNMADSYAKVRPVAVCLTLNQTDVEREFDPPLARVYVMKSRHGQEGRVLNFVTDYKVARIYEDTMGAMSVLQATVPDASRKPSGGKAKAKAEGPIRNHGKRYSPRRVTDDVDAPSTSD